MRYTSYGMRLISDSFSSMTDKSLSRKQNQLSKQVWGALLVMVTEFGSFLSIFFEHQSDELAGFSGLLHLLQGAPSLIFGIRPRFWGRGYA
jgi:RimJ/RimL family protein N-acetyltransferase